MRSEDKKWFSKCMKQMLWSRKSIKKLQNNDYIQKKTPKKTSS